MGILLIKERREPRDEGEGREREERELRTT